MRGSSDSFLDPTREAPAPMVDALGEAWHQAPFLSGAPGAKVWILDDDRSLCKLLDRQLRVSGWLPLVIHSGRDLENSLVDIYPDLLVLDQMLPDKAGIEILSNLRKSGHLFPVLMLSALGEPEDRVLGLEVGADDYLTKPFNSRELILRIERLLNLGKPSSFLAGSRIERFQIADLVFDPTESSLASSTAVTSLSRGEVVLLSRFCQSPGLIVSREQLARDSGSLVDVNKSRSLDMRISNLRRQLHALSPGLGDQLETVRGRGYRLVAKLYKITPSD